MSALGHAAPHARAQKSISGPAQLILVRVGADGGATRAELASDLAPLFTHKLSPQDFRRLAEKETAALVAAGLVAETKNRLSLTAAGETAFARFFSQKAYEARPWHELRDLTLIAKGLGCEKEASARLKPLLRVEGLRSLIVQKAFGLPTRKNQPPTRQRAQLAVVALERAFGNRIKAGFGKGSALSSKAGRLLAGQLSRTPRSFSTDAKLIAALAAEHVGAVETDLDALRIAILRGLGTRALGSRRQRRGSGSAAPGPGSDIGTSRPGRARRQRSHTRSDGRARSRRCPPRPRRILARRKGCRLPACRGLARQPQGVYLPGVGCDSRRQAALGTLRDRIQMHAG